ncbi:helix-turn-helix domain-containing protein [Crossiella sp. CA198]|uniref:helix-turn-helix domain-containing protein n=1 Tax=Crossiella sp. CA198 TaxID=3455607 RepID=UPI003F8D387D
MEEREVPGQRASDGVTAARSAFVERLRYLLEQHPAGPHTPAEVAAGTGLSQSGIYALLSPRANPTVETMATLASFFGVPLGYFVDEQIAERTRAELGLLSRLKDAGAQKVALRSTAPMESASLPELLDLIGAAVEQARRLKETDGPRRPDESPTE